MLPYLFFYFIQLHRFLFVKLWNNVQEEGLFGHGLGWDSVEAYPYSQYGIQSLIKGGDTILYHGSMIVLPEYNMAFAALLSGGSSLYAHVMGHKIDYLTSIIQCICPLVCVRANKRTNTYRIKPSKRSLRIY
jgi:hypothetical protein